MTLFINYGATLASALKGVPMHLSSVPFRTLLFLFCLSLPYALPAAASPEKKTVLVSILPQKYFVERLAGEYVDCLVLVDRGGDPHTYEPTVTIMANASRAALYFTIGVPFEYQWMDRFTSLNPGLEVVTPAIVLQAQPETAHAEPPHPGTEPGGGHGRGRDSGHDEDAMHSHDPHIWLSPAAMREVVPGMRDALIRLLPAHTDRIAANAASLLRDMEALEQEVTAYFARLPENRRAFLTFHHAWGYYARNFGLSEYSVEYMGKEPGPRGMAELVAMAEKNGIRVIVVSPGTNRSSARALAANIGGVAIEADPLAGDWPDNIRRISRALANGLGAEQ